MARPYRPLVPIFIAARWLPERVARIPVSINTKLLVAFLGIVALLVVLGAVGLDNLRIVNERVAELARQQNSIPGGVPSNRRPFPTRDRRSPLPGNPPR